MKNTQHSAQETFLSQYPHSNRAQAVKKLYELYSFYTFYGTNNTPLFIYETKKIQPNAKKGYQGSRIYKRTSIPTHRVALEVLFHIIDHFLDQKPNNSG